MYCRRSEPHRLAQPLVESGPWKCAENGSLRHNHGDTRGRSFRHLRRAKTKTAFLRPHAVAKTLQFSDQQCPLGSRSKPAFHKHTDPLWQSSTGESRCPPAASTERYFQWLMVQEPRVSIPGLLLRFWCSLIRALSRSVGHRLAAVPSGASAALAPCVFVGTLSARHFSWAGADLRQRHPNASQP
jgi:hypothetical protein